MNDKEFNAAVLELKRYQGQAKLKFAALMVLMFISVFGILSLTYLIPKAVFDYMGVDYKEELP